MKPNVCTCALMPSCPERAGRHVARLAWQIHETAAQRRRDRRARWQVGTGMNGACARALQGAPACPRSSTSTVTWVTCPIHTPTALSSVDRASQDDVPTSLRLVTAYWIRAERDAIRSAPRDRIEKWRDRPGSAHEARPTGDTVGGGQDAIGASTSRTRRLYPAVSLVVPRDLVARGNDTCPCPCERHHTVQWHSAIEGVLALESNHGT